MSLFVYILCALTSLTCAVLLLRAYRRTGVRLLLWSGLCFAFMFVNNAMVIVDYRFFPQRDLSLLRLLPSVAGVVLLVYGLIWGFGRMNTFDAWVQFLSAIVVAGYAVAALFFLRFWARARDRLFLFFAAAFALLTVQGAALTFVARSPAPPVWYYVIRFAAFSLILAAIIDKNRAGTR